MAVATPEVLLVNVALTDASLAKLGAATTKFLYFPDGDVPRDALQKAQAWLTTSGGLPPSITDVAQVPKLRHLQLLSAGANAALACPAITKCLAGGVTPSFSLSTASGIHADSISQYIVGTLLMLLNKLDKQIVHARTKATWADGAEFAEERGLGDGTIRPNDTPYFNRQLRGKTVGFLGYGHIARESARLLQAFNTTIIAANTSGSAREDDGFVPSGTGDATGTIPEEYYRTGDPSSLELFLSRSEVLICSLPSTKETRFLLDEKRLALLPPHTILINVGRGDLVSSDALFQSLNSPEGLLGLAIDVTDPEPLPDGHPLWTHPNAIVTPHLSGDAEGEFDLAVEVFLENVKRLREGRKAANLVDWEKGY